VFVPIASSSAHSSSPARSLPWLAAFRLGEALADYPEAHIAIAGVILIVLIRFAPHGVVGLAAKLPLTRRVPA
jgi:hypothetical protein